MTTIALKDGVLAWDSRMARGPTITDNNYDKCHRKGSDRFVLSGHVADTYRLVADYPNTEGEYRCEGFRVDAIGQVWDIHAFEGYTEFPVPAGTVAAYGSGCDHALTAMDLGCSAKEAVRMAAKRDAQTGGRVRTMKVKA